MSKLKLSALHLAIGSSLLTGLAFNANAAVENSAEEVERIEVTGSRIKRTDMESASPVTIIGADEIAASGAISIDGILQGMSISSGAMTNPGINNGSQGNTTINLRGLGEERTLVLVNGRRMIASGTGAAASVDLNTIPTSMIQRIEVLKDGASAIYGTDAVAGVVNIILKRDFEGFEINAQSGISGEGDAEESSIDFTLGTQFDKGNLVLGVQYSDRGEASQANRDFSNCPIAESSDGTSTFCAGSSYIEGGHIWGNKNHGIVGTGTDGAYKIGDTGHYGKYIQDDAANAKPGATKFVYHEGMKQADLAGLGGYHSFSNTDRFNYSKDSYLYTPQQRFNITANGTYELSDTTRMFTEVMYTKRWSEQQMAPQPIWNSNPWVYNSSWMNKDLLAHGVQEGETLSYGRRMSDTGTRDFSQVVDTLRFVLGFEGEFANDWTWDVSYNKGRNDSVDKLSNLHNIGSIDSAVQAKTFDPFTQASWSGDSIAPFIYTEVNSGGSEMDIFTATVAGELFDMPAGTVGIAMGYEHRLESAYFTPDSLTAQGLANDPRVEETKGSFNVNEAYIELAVPLLSDSPIAELVDLSLAARYFDYNTFGDDLTWKAGLTWKVNDNLMFRSVASTAYRAPTVDELFSGKSPSFEQVVHPASQDQAEVTVGGNSELTPEEADILTLGVVFEPVDNLSVTLDYFDIDITNAINELDANYVLNQCLNSAGQNINNETALCQSAAVTLDGTGRAAFNNGKQNVGGQITSGYDVNVAYSFEAAGIDWKASLDTSILDKFEETDQDGNVINYKGLITGTKGSYAEVKSNFRLTAKANNWLATYKARFISSVDSKACESNPSSCYAPSVDAITYHDLSGSWYMSDSVTISGGVNNLFDKQAPYFTGNNDANTDAYTYDVLGRYFFGKVSVKF